MSDERKPEGGAPPPKREKPLRDLPELPEPDTQDSVRGGRATTPAAPSPIPIPYPN